MTKRTAIFLLLALCGPALFGQFIPNSSFLFFEQKPCPFDPGISIKKPVGWQIYQTTDGNWDGPFDSTRCLNVVPGPFGYHAQLDLSAIDPAEPVFFRAQLDTVGLEKDFIPDNLCNINFSARIAQGCTDLITGAGCTQDLCSGVFAGVAIPDENGNAGAATRVNTAVLTTVNQGSDCILQAQSCFPTEYFPEQTLQYFVLKFSFDANADLTGKVLQVDFAFLEQLYPGYVGTIDQVDATPNEFNGDHYDVPAYATAQTPSWNGNYLMLYTAPTYPSAADPSYVEAAPIPNVSSPQTINLVVYPGEALEMQPFTHLRGALVAGSDSIRHTANLVNMGGDLCINYLDVIFNGGDEYRHGGGRLEMNNPFSCMQFHNGSALRVLEGATLQYGQDGVGMLALCANSTLAIERNATLIIDGILNLAECDDNLPPQNISMDLPPGSRLIFTKNAWLTNRFSQGQQMRLDVHMNGGELDDAALSAEERALINRIYPAPAVRFDDNIRIGPNPFTDPPQLAYVAAGPEKVLLEWVDLNGRTLQTETFTAVRGMNFRALTTPEAAGCYMLRISSSSGTTMRKMVKTAP